MKSQTVALRRVLLLATAAAASLLHTSAWAADETANADAETEVETVVVVGSQIRGAKETGALPVTVVGVEDIKATGAVTAEDLFRALPAAGDVSFNTTFLGGGSANAARGDVSTVSLRGLGQGNTLSLLNGRRLVLHPTSQTDNSVPVFGYNVNAVPLAGLARPPRHRSRVGPCPCGRRIRGRCACRGSWIHSCGPRVGGATPDRTRGCRDVDPLDS